MTGRFPKWRLRFLTVITALVVCILLFRIVQVQIIQHENYISKAKSQWHEKITWPARRGSILDRNGLPLAVTYRTYSLGITPMHFPKEEVEAVEYLIDLLDLSPRKFRNTLAKKCAYVPLGRNLCLAEGLYKPFLARPKHHSGYSFRPTSGVIS